MASKDGAGGHDLTPEDFEAIREAVMETPRGRWFLNEYASRLRRSETSGLLDSMKRLEGAVASNHDQLMARLAQALSRDNVTAPGPSAPQPDLAPKHMKFFRQDEEIFEPAPQARIAAVPEVKKPEPKPEVPKGARVVFRRTAETAVAIEASPAIEVPPVTEAAPPPPAPPPPEPQPQAEAPKRRIVIIRHKPGEQIDVPLADDVARAS